MEVDRPQAVIGFLQPDLLIGERIGEVEQSLAEFEGPARGDALDEKLPGELGHTQA
jgi:hypothetical protein